jgi:hypothetical protein
LYQIILNHWGLSLGEIEAINSIFKDYELIESEVTKSIDHASTIEIEFVKNSADEFFSCISIEKWNTLVDIIKNIKKRRGNKGLRFRMTITEYIEADESEHSSNDDNSNSQIGSNNSEAEVELLFRRKMIYLLLYQGDSEFIKGLERIEVSIESMTNLLSKSIRLDPPRNEKKDKENSNIKYESIQFDLFHQIQLFTFLFDYEKRVWKNL